MTEDLATKLTTIAALAEPARRDLYRYVAGQDRPVSREQASAATGLPHHAVKFHLDRLVEVGLLDVEYRRLTGRRSPGAGRPAKLYRRATRDLSVSVPERRYELAAWILADAVRDAAGGVPLPVAVDRAAGAAGRRAGVRARGDAADAARRPRRWPGAGTSRIRRVTGSCCPTARSRRWPASTRMWCAG